MDIQTIIEQILEKIPMDKWEKIEFSILIDGRETNPTYTMDMTDVGKLSKKLNDIGLLNSFTLGRGPDDVKWKLKPNGISNYVA